ncbi:mevalonate kinase-like [Nylanderia fulva]|uniref:mevalonate kinase-like n=1 Tax=Nylanderia fulva TaxID=613905 RepID=UPI0010FB8AD5|nr:mevalonate kinase-like [Nylanderia fulva]
MVEELIHFKISAPGRIVLSGEHSAIYRKHFVATSLNLRTNLEFWELNDLEKFIHIEFPEVNFTYNIDLKIIKFFCGDNEVNSTLDNFIKYLKYMITVYGLWITFTQKRALMIFFYLLFETIKRGELEIKPFRIKVTSELPINSGLGSSTSFAVCVAACFLHWKRLHTQNQPVEFDNPDFKKEVKSYVASYEDFLLDYDCAWIDTDVCIYGNIRKSRLTDYINVDTVDSQDLQEMKILLVPSKVPQKKHHQTKQMIHRKLNSNAESNEFEILLNELDDVAIQIYDNLKSLSDNIKNIGLRECRQHYKSLRKSIKWNQQLLCNNFLTNEEFDKICKIAKDKGFAGKLTGFAAKYVYILLPPYVKKEKSRILKQN